jgi:four helix bundle protein
MTYVDYHKLTVYSKAKELVLKTLEATENLPRKVSVEIVAKQLIRAVSSIGANIVEGYGRNNPREFRQFLGIARGSSFETEYWLEILTKILNVDLSALIELNKECIRLLTFSIKNLGNKTILPAQ